MRKIVLALAVLAGFAAPTVANAGGVNWCRYIVASQCIRADISALRAATEVLRDSSVEGKAVSDGRMKVR
jgi:hypothetical protein